MSRFIYLVIIAIMFLLVCCGKEEKARVTTDGSSSMERVIGALGESFEERTGIEFTYNPAGSGSGIKAVLEGRCDIGLSSRELKEEELEAGLDATVLAYDGIVIIVNKQNPIKDLSIDMIAKIFKGEIRNWSEIGGEDFEIVLVGREAGSGTRDGFETVVNIKDACDYRQELTSTGDVITTVSNNPGGIGYASLASLKNNVKALSVNGIEATESSIKDGSYIIRRPFILVTRRNEELNDAARKFFEYITSEDASEIIRAAGVVPEN